MKKEKTIVIIPAYEPPQEFIAYAKQVADFAERLVVVNDGSGQDFDEIFKAIEAIENAKYITYAENHGKGYALKQAFRYCAENYDDDYICVTADCDGHHAIEDIESVACAAFNHSNALILGSRDFDTPNVPKKSRMGNTNIRIMFRLLYGLDLSDTQTGLRGFSVNLAKRFISVHGDRFEFETDMLIYSQKNKIPILELPIKTIYPDNPEDHVTHFKVIRDSLKIVGATLRNLNWYLLSSALSGILDITVFFVLSSIILGAKSAVNTLIATVSARVASSVLNFALNKKCVFNSKSKRSIYRYYVLWFCQLGASYGLIFLFGNVIGLPMTPMKIAIDLVLAFFSYQIQQHWVFKNKKENQFYGPFVTVIRWFAKIFTKRYKSYVTVPTEPTVYICRHLNMHGPFTTLIRMNFHVHPMVLHVFFDKRTCYTHYVNYTFTERRGKKRKKHHPFAYISSRVVVPLEKSIKGIPVYRGEDYRSLQTLKASMQYLKQGESIIVYPDKDYTAGYDKESEIYEGFLLLGQMYKRATGKSLRFVPLYIDEKTRTINECPPFQIDCFKEKRDEIYRYTKAAINGKVK